MTHEKKWLHLIHRTHKAQIMSIMAGAESTEVWLGPEEMEILKKQVDVEAALGHIRDTAEITEREILGLRIMEAKENGIHVGVTFKPTS